jgi:hypothetical protein
MTVIDTAEMYADGAATHTLPRALINRVPCQNSMYM